MGVGNSKKTAEVREKIKVKAIRLISDHYHYTIIIIVMGFICRKWTQVIRDASHSECNNGGR